MAAGGLGGGFPPGGGCAAGSMGGAGLGAGGLAGPGGGAGGGAGGLGDGVLGLGDGALARDVEPDAVAVCGKARTGCFPLETGGVGSELDSCAAGWVCLGSALACAVGR